MHIVIKYGAYFTKNNGSLEAQAITDISHHIVRGPVNRYYDGMFIGTGFFEKFRRLFEKIWWHGGLFVASDDVRVILWCHVSKQMYVVVVSDIT